MHPGMEQYLALLQEKKPEHWQEELFASPKNLSITL